MVRISPDHTLRPYIIAVSGDPGGARAIAPVVRSLREQALAEVRVLALDTLHQVWAERHLACELLPQPLLFDFALNLVDNASLVITGTSSAPIDCEKKFIAAARTRGVPSLTVLDFWSNYAERFSDETGRLVYLPDCIAVMDVWARDEMIAAGFPSNRLTITGQPAFDELGMWRNKTTPLRCQAVRALWNVRADDLFVLFASQPLSLLFGIDTTSPRYPGYDEQSVFRALLSALEEISARRKRKITLAVRLHAKEHPDWLDNFSSPNIRISRVVEQSPYELVLASDLVVGMTSTLLIAACYLGCVTVSLQPNLRMPDRFPMSRWGWGRTVYRTEEITTTIESVLLNEIVRANMRQPLLNLRLDGQATQRVVELACSMIETCQTGNKK